MSIFEATTSILAFQDIKTTMVGVINKISDQAKAMANLFPSFKCYVIGNHDDALLNLLPKHDYVKLISIPLKSKKNVLQLIKFRKKEAQIALNLFIAEPPLYLYFRYPLGCPWMLSLMKKFSSLGIRTITEHQSFEEKELLALKKFHFWASEFFFGRHCLSYAYGVVGVTEEITAYQKKRAPHAKALCIPNGIDTSKFPFRKSLSSNPYQRLDMLFVGSLANWHGLDRLIRGMKEKRNNCFLHIVGDGSEKEQLQNITSSLGLEQNVFFYGLKTIKK
jgi:glycosyltransferase involved in cell wall biosynthesis